jgi:hypothetical protein
MDDAIGIVVLAGQSKQEEHEDGIGIHHDSAHAQGAIITDVAYVITTAYIHRYYHKYCHYHTTTLTELSTTSASTRDSNNVDIIAYATPLQ